MLKIELDIFSGQPNPSWTLTSKEEAQLVDRLLADKSQMQPLNQSPSKLGYRGFIVNALSEDDGSWHNSKLPSAFRLGLSSLSQSVENWLIDTNLAHIDDVLKEHVRSEILTDGKPVSQIDGVTGVMGPGQSCPSNYISSDTDFSFWAWPWMWYNNCYNFASAYRSNDFAQPGNLGGKKFSSLTTSELVAAVKRDGYSDYCTSGSNVCIALVLWPGTDFHFYRLCANGHWCHKPGGTYPTNKDNSNNWIYWPSSCNRGNYTTFCGYFYSNGPRPV